MDIFILWIFQLIGYLLDQDLFSTRSRSRQYDEWIYLWIYAMAIGIVNISVAFFFLILWSFDFDTWLDIYVNISSVCPTFVAFLVAGAIIHQRKKTHFIVFQNMKLKSLYGWGKYQEKTLNLLNLLGCALNISHQTT